MRYTVALAGIRDRSLGWQFSKKYAQRWTSTRESARPQQQAGGLNIIHHPAAEPTLNNEPEDQARSRAPTSRLPRFLHMAAINAGNDGAAAHDVLHAVIAIPAVLAMRKADLVTALTDRDLATVGNVTGTSLGGDVQ